MDRKQVHWRCRRATLELDLLLNGFFEAHYDQLSESEKMAFQQCLKVDDQILMGWLFQGQPCDDLQHQPMVQRLLDHTMV